jgi:hypothetical protein
MDPITTGMPNVIFPNDPIQTSGTAEQSGQADAAKNGVSAPKGKTNDINHRVKSGYRSSPAECQTCKNRKYQDGSDENVSFKAAAHISPEAAGARVRGHESEHVANAYTKAAEKGGKVIAANVTIHTAICPECGRTYVSGGTTSTIISYPSSNDKSTAAGNGTGENSRAGTQKGENFTA